MLDFLGSTATLAWNTGLVAWAAFGLLFMDFADVYDRLVRPRLPEHWQEILMGRTRMIVRVVAIAVVVFSVVKPFHSLRMQNMELAKVRAYMDDATPKQGIQYAKRVVLFSNQTTQPTILSVKADKKLEDCDFLVDKASFSIMPYHYISKDDPSVCHMSLESPAVSPARAVVITLYSNEQISEISVLEIGQGD